MFVLNSFVVQMAIIIVSRREEEQILNIWSNFYGPEAQSGCKISMKGRYVILLKNVLTKKKFK